jgi:hypothetical protein
MSLDGGRGTLPNRVVGVEDLRDAYIQFEQARFLFRSRTGPFGGRGDESDVAELQHQLQVLSSDNRFMAIADTVRYRMNMPQREMGTLSIFHPELVDGTQITVARAIQLLIGAILSFPHDAVDALELDLNDTSAPSSKEAVAHLKRIVPKEQSVAPVQFDILDNRLIITSQPGRYLEEDKASIAAARQELADKGRGVIEQLERSNCDRRLLETFQDLQNKLGTESDVIRLGLSNIACELMCDRFECELPQAVSAMIKAHTFGLNMYVAQFPEWQRFTEQAATVEFTSDDVPRITAAVDAVVANLADKPDLADPEVPRTLLALREMISDPSAATKRAVFSVWRSLENLVIKVYQYGAEFLEKSISKAIDSGSTVVGKGLVVALMSAALGGALAMAPVASHISQSSWIAQASQVVRSQIEALSK